MGLAVRAIEQRGRHGQRQDHVPGGHLTPPPPDRRDTVHARKRRHAGGWRRPPPVDQRPLPREYAGRDWVPRRCFLDRFVDEVEQVRWALGLDRHNFVLFGHSWGGILAIEYALRHQEHLRGLVISSMMASVPAYNAYAEQVLMPRMDQAALAEIKSYEANRDIEIPRYMELLNEQHYVHHVLRMPVADWPDPVVRAFAHINPAIYVSMQGPSELGISADASLAHWNRTEELASIEVLALVIGARHDTMDPGHMEMMACRLPHGRYLYCPDGSHMATYDDQAVYFAGLVDFLHNLEGE